MSTKMERFHALIERQSNEITELKKNGLKAQTAMLKLESNLFGCG